MHLKVILYTTPTCVQCKFLKQLMYKKSIEFEVCEDMEVMRGLGITSVPVLNVEGVVVKNPMKWVNEQ